MKSLMTALTRDGDDVFKAKYQKIEKTDAYRNVPSEELNNSLNNSL